MRLAFARMGDQWLHTARLCLMLYDMNRGPNSPNKSLSFFLPPAFKPDEDEE